MKYPYGIQNQSEYYAIDPKVRGELFEEQKKWLNTEQQEWVRSLSLEEMSAYERKLIEYEKLAWELRSQWDPPDQHDYAQWTAEQIKDFPSNLAAS